MKLHPVRLYQGIDIVSIDRFKVAAEKGGKLFLSRIFTPSERGYCEPKRMKYEHYAARFAAKEAVIKAAPGKAKKKVDLTGIEICRKASGKPFLKIAKPALKKLGILPKAQMELSLAHERDCAIATVMILQ